MSAEPENLTQKADDAQPNAEWSPVPVLLIGLIALLGYIGMVYLNDFGGGFDAHVYSPYDSYAQLDSEQPHDPDAERRILGQRLFTANCSPCHQVSGLGVPGQFPPLAGSEWVNAQSPNRILRAVLDGLQGPIKVKDQPFNNVMVPWKSVFKDEEIAAILTFVRQNKDWGNKAPAVTADQVKAIRDKIKSHEAAFTPDELLKIPEGE